MAKIMHVQTVLVVEDLEALKQKTGEVATKDALAKASPSLPLNANIRSRG